MCTDDAQRRAEKKKEKIDTCAVFVTCKTRTEDRYTSAHRGLQVLYYHTVTASGPRALFRQYQKEKKEEKKKKRATSSKGCVRAYRGIEQTNAGSGGATLANHAAVAVSPPPIIVGFASPPPGRKRCPSLNRTPVQERRSRSWYAAPSERPDWGEGCDDPWEHYSSDRHPLLRASVTTRRVPKVHGFATEAPPPPRRFVRERGEKGPSEGSRRRLLDGSLGDVVAAAPEATSSPRRFHEGGAWHS